MSTVGALQVTGFEGLVGSEIPYLTYGNPSLGPSVTLISGVHGCEYSSMLGLRRFLEGLDESELQGQITAVPIINLAAFAGRTPFLVPHDGLNLNRTFPGDPAGSFTERLANMLIEQVFRGADALVDMHCGDMVEALEPFSLWDASPVEEQSKALADAYGLAYGVRLDRTGSPIAGTSSATCAELGIPAITAEAGGCGLVEDDKVALHVDGLKRLFAHLGMLPDVVAPAPPPVQLSNLIWLRSVHAGWWSPTVLPGEHAKAGTLLGTVSPLLGGEQFEVEEIVAPEDGVVIFNTSSPAVADDGLLSGLGVL